jgi:hypothetical protein
MIDTIWTQWASPANVILLVTLILLLVVVALAQRRDDFDWADALRDDSTDKITVLRVTAIGAFGVSSWVVMHEATENQMTDTMFLIYCVTWSSSILLSKFLDRWSGGTK